MLMITELFYHHLTDYKDCFDERKKFRRLKESKVLSSDGLRWDDFHGK